MEQLAPVCAARNVLSFLWHQTLVVFVVILLQEAAIDCLIAPAGARHVLLAERRVLTVEVTVKRKIVGEIFCSP